MEGLHRLYYRLHTWFNIKSMCTKLGSRLGISLYSQAKTLAYSFKSAMSWVLSSYDRFALIEVVRGTLGSLLRSTTSSSILAGKDKLGVSNNSSHGLAMLSKECSAGAAISAMLLRECSTGATVSAMLLRECSAGAAISRVQQQVGVVLASFSLVPFCLRQLGPVYRYNQ